MSSEHPRARKEHTHIADLPPYPDIDAGDDTRIPRWVKVIGIIAIVLLLLVVIVMITGGDGGHRPPEGTH